jgi:hypothetical protein
MSKKLGMKVEIQGHFLRSVRLDTDLGRTDVLKGFVLQPSAMTALEILARHINDSEQRAFTWTGPYGGGKSSLALALCSLVHSEPLVRSTANKILRLQRGSILAKAFNYTGDAKWIILPVVGKRGPVITEIARVIDHFPSKKHRGTIRRTSRDVIAELVHMAENPRTRGVLLVIDELGKFLDEAAQSGHDIYFYQELAEAAARTRGKLIVIGILHQSFDQYASQLGRDFAG